MATEILYLKGKAKWARLYKPDDEYDNFKLNLYMDEASKALFDASGMQLTPKTDEDGEYVTFRRPNTKQIKKELVVLGPPKVVDADGNPFDKLIGNGSTVVIKVSVYDSRRGKGHRLEAVQVLDWVEFVADGEGGDSHIPVPVTVPDGVEAF